jgi:hypothetical protein
MSVGKADKDLSVAGKASKVMSVWVALIVTFSVLAIFESSHLWII